MYDTKSLDNLLRPDEDFVNKFLTRLIDDDREVTQKGEHTLKDVPHAVIVVLNADSCAIPKEMVNFIRTFKQKKYQPLFVFTKVDKDVDPNDGLGWVARFNAKRNELVDLLNSAFPEDGFMHEDIVLCSNYRVHPPGTPLSTIEWCALNILEKSVVKAEEWLLQNHFTYKSKLTSFWGKLFGW
eukprot:Phypoly_transcript_14945.p1 GENE.Phypoly_transcript_14945~~Phypoly_transcript_14945.p1  ORF type:complete len:183 (+),score=24.96 Phypoly_transcript_14945:361-909(+)